MATKTKKATAAPKKKTTKKPTAKGEKIVRLKPIGRKHVTLTIKGFGGPLVQHAWDEKAKRMIQDKQKGLKTKTKSREIRDPEREIEAACYKTEDGKYGVDLRAIKKSILSAAHRDLGIERALVARALFVPRVDSTNVIPFEKQTQYEKGEDMVIVGMRSADIRYRPYWPEWSVRVTFELDTALLEVEDFCTLVGWAGSRVGIGEMRPEKHGDFGRYRIDMDKPITEKPA